MRTALALFFYAAALTLIYAGVSAAPDMRWPTNDHEMMAAALVTLGLLAKLLGHLFMLAPGWRR